MTQTAEFQIRTLPRDALRARLEDGQRRALALMRHPDQEVRRKAKKSLEHAEIALGLLDRAEQLTTR
jgi:hypothetical protein